MADLNPSQDEAVRFLDGPCLVIAGAGSGKTRVITAKLAHLIESGFASRAIAAITFTNKAASEMAERFAGAVKLAAAGPADHLHLPFAGHADPAHAAARRSASSRRSRSSTPTTAPTC